MKLFSPPSHVKQVTFALICSFYFLLFSKANAQAISGIKTVGPTNADYTSISGALGALATNGINGDVFIELQSGYLSSVETFPIIIGEIPGANNTKTVTIRPELNATGLILTSNDLNTIYLWSGKYIRFDGRPGGVGSTSELTIANINIAGRAVYFANDASNNIFRYCTITGVTASVTSGVVTFGTGTTNGNDSNTIEYCALNAGATNPTYLIYSAGSTTNANIYNSRNQIKNCNLINFGGSLAEAGALKMNGGNTEWTISSNHIFQTAPTVGVIAQIVYGINLNVTANNTGNGHTITNNYIGGTAPFCGGSAWTSSSTGLSTFKGIDVNVGATVPALVQNNVINNFNWATASPQAANYGIWSGIWLAGGAADIKQNTIGSLTGSDSIVISSSAHGNLTFGIGSSSTTANSIINIQNNSIGSFKISGTASGIGCGFMGIYMSGTPGAASIYNVTDNKIGSNIPNNIISTNAATTVQSVMGINNNTAATNTTVVNITGNKIQNLHNNQFGTTFGQTIGIRSSGGTNNISNDTIINISNASPQIGVTLNTSVIGIMLTSTAPQNHLVNKNLIYGLVNTNTTATATQVTGIYYAATSSIDGNIVSNNFIHSLSSKSTEPTASIIGIDILNGKASYQSNIIRLGIDKIGISIFTGYVIKGINETGTGLNNFYHNSVYIGGSNIIQASNTYAFFSAATPAVGRNIMNNIWVNNRSDVSAGASSNYSVLLATRTNTTSNGNLYFTQGTSGKIGIIGATSYATFSDWVKQTAVFDGAGIYASPNFINATGDSSAINMHVQSPTPVERNGVPITNVTADVDAETRNSLSPFDIGADAGNFTGPDLASPSISYNDLPNTFSTLDSLLVATIADGTGLDPVGSMKPKLYFKKTSAVAYSSVSGVLISGNGKEGQWQFPLNGSLLGGFNAGDTIQYFIAAQDSAATPNIGSFPAGITASNVNTITGYPLFPKTYRILLPLQGTKTIGIGGSYPNLSKAFEDATLNGLGGPLTLELLSTYSSANEVFPLVIPAIQGNSNFNTITIVPQTGATGLSISSATEITIDLNGAKYIRFDGRVGGAGNANLTIENTSVSGTPVRFINDAVYNTLTYCKLKGVNSTINAAVIVFGSTTGTTGNDNNTISYCDISSGATPSAIGIYCAGTAATEANSNSDNIITNNTFHDIWKTTTESASIKCPTTSGGQRWTITNNSFFQTQSVTSTGTNHHQAIIVMAGDNHVISGNYIGGSQALCGGTPWTLAVTTAARFTGMNLRFDTLGSLVENNVIANFNWQSSANTFPTSGGIWTGIYLGTVGVATIQNNTIGSLTNNNSVVVSSTATGSFALGILSVSSTKGLITISKNKIGGFTTNTDATTKACNFTGIYTGGTTSSETQGLIYNIDSNIIGNVTALQKASVIQVVIGIQNSVAMYSAFSPVPFAGSGESVPIVNHVYFRARNNTIMNLANKHAGNITVGQTIGIRTTTGVNILEKNTIYNLWNTSPQAGVGINVPVAGIVQSCAAVALQSVSRNTIYNLFSDTVVNVALGVTGIAYSGIASGANTVAGNFIHHLIVKSTNNTSAHIGIHPIMGNANYFNNMVSLGSDTLGSSLPDFAFYGIKEDSGTNNYYHNSIHIGNSISSAGTINTYSFYSNSSSTNARNIVNNIFSNQRSASSGLGMHYCITVRNTTNLVANRNVYTLGASGTNALGRFASNDYFILSIWQTATNQDKASAIYAHSFVAPDASSSLIDLHVQGTTPIEGGGIFIPAVTVDIDGHLRDTLSPVDIGADAGNFTTVDLFPPSISHTKLANTADTTNRIIVAQINDATGVALMGTAPRMYYRTGTTTFVSVQGTKVSGTAQNGIWEFVMDRSLVTGGINRGDSLYYFFIAQDATPANNIASFPDGADAFDVASVNVPPPTFYSYRLLAPMSGTYLVGSGNLLKNLTDSNGAFAFMLTDGIIGDVELSVTSDLVESGKFEFPVTNYKITVVPSSNTVRNIVGDYGVAPLIRFKGVRNITIDGRYNGTGRYLRFLNTNVNRPTIGFLNDATRDTIMYCIIEGGNTSSYVIGGSEQIGVIAFNAAVSKGNDSNCVRNCYITPGPGQTPNFLITSTGPNTVGRENSENSIIYNEFVNQGVYGLQLAAGTGANWDISNNSFYRTTPTTGLQFGMQIYNGDAYTISNNNFGGSAPDRSGNPYQTSSNMSAINLTNTSSLNIVSNVTGNKMSNIVITGPNQYCQAFVIAGGKVNVSNNIIGGGAMPYDSIITGGINQLDIIQVTAGAEINITNNTIGNIYYFGTNNLRIAAVNVFSGTSTGSISNNTIRDIYSSTPTIADYTVGISLNAGNNYTVSNNTIFNLVNRNLNVATMVAGVNVIAGTNHKIVRNRIYNLGAYGTGIVVSSPLIFGVRVATTGNVTVANNQISLGLAAANESRVYGLYDASVSGNNKYYYNSVFINGTMTGDNNSYGFYRNSTSNIDVRNNVFYNKRISLGAGKNYATAAANVSGIVEGSLNYNLAIVNDTAAITEMPITVANGWSNISALYTTTNNTNWTELVSNVPAQSLFTDTTIGNLNIDIANDACWYVNGKGIRIAGFSGDYSTETGIRSESIVNGATDLGSDEITTSTLPPSAVLSSTSIVGSAYSSNYTFGGRNIMSVSWSSLGTPPSALNVRYYSGINPPNATAGKTRLNAYWDLNPTGGSGYTFDLSLLQDSAIMGTVSSFSNIEVARYNLSAPNWISYPTVSNIVQGNFTSANLPSSLGIFTGTDGSNNPLPVQLLSFKANKAGKDVLLTWVTVSEVNANSFIVESSIDNKNWSTLGRVKANGNNKSTSNYKLTDGNAFARNNTVFYRLQTVDNDGSSVYSNIISISNKQSEAQPVTVYPNPFNSDLTIELNSEIDGIANIQMMDITGRSVDVNINKELKKGNNILSINTDDLESGIYFLSMEINGVKQNVKVIKQ
jgi:hypothetical protein